MIPSRKLSKGSIGWMATNSVAANLLMIVMLIGGSIIAWNMKQEVFPEFELGMVDIKVKIPGATPEEVEKSAVMSIEQAIQGIDGIKEVTSSSNEGSATVLVELEDGINSNIALQDIKSAVDRITTFPVEAEPPQISLRSTRHEVLTLVLVGTNDPLVLREWAENIRDELLQAPGITQVELDNVLDHEIIVEVPENTLRRYGLTLTDIAERIKQSALELGSGTLRADSGDVMVRLNERKDFARQFMDIPVKSTPEGSRLLLEDVANVTDGFEDTTRYSTYNGQNTILIDVYRIGQQTPTSVAKAAMTVIDRLNQTMPGKLQLHILRNDADIFMQRADLLRNNAIVGMILVFASLSLFLQPSLAFWVSLGIPISFMGSFLILGPLGVSINMMSMFAFILTLGIVVDDAIVVGENVRSYRERGFSYLEASILGTKEVGGPVIFSILTNMVAFMPMFFIPGIMGKIWGVIPLVVVAVFLCSLLESLFVLPSHLAHQSKTRKKGIFKILNKFTQAQENFSKKFMQFVEYRYGATLNFAIRKRYLVLTSCVGLLILSFTYVASGRLGFDLMPRTDADFAFAQAILPTGSSEKQIIRVRDKLIASAQEVVEKNGGDTLSTGVYALVRGPDISVRIYLTPADIRPLNTASVTNLWRENTGELPGLESISFESDRGGPGSGKGLTIRLSHRDTNILEQAAKELGEMFGNYANLSDVDTGTSRTKRQFDISLTPLAQQMGFTARNIAEQVRASFEGAIALRQQRGRSEVTVRVRLPKEDRTKESTFENLILRVPGTGKEVLLRDIVNVNDGRAYAVIRHTDGRRTATVAAAVTPASATGMMMETTRSQILPELMSRYPGLSWEYGGRQADIQDSMNAMYIGLAMALLAIFALLAIPFKSYTQPLIIMIAIPFGAVGAIGGHWIMGYSLSVISVVGIIALAGVVVNDSLVLIDFANRRRQDGFTAFEAMRMAGIQRFRPILLTTVTTFAGLAPMIFETSRQARMLIPVALSLGFGILFATVICLILVPSLYMILEDIHPATVHDAVKK